MLKELENMRFVSDKSLVSVVDGTLDKRGRIEFDTKSGSIHTVLGSTLPDNSCMFEISVIELDSQSALMIGLFRT